MIVSYVDVLVLKIHGSQTNNRFARQTVAFHKVQKELVIHHYIYYEPLQRHHARVSNPCKPAIPGTLEEGPSIHGFQDLKYFYLHFLQYISHILFLF